MRKLLKYKSSLDTSIRKCDGVVATKTSTNIAGSSISSIAPLNKNPGEGVIFYPEHIKRLLTSEYNNHSSAFK